MAMNSTLHPKALGLAFGIVWGAGVALLAFFAMLHGSYGSTIIGILSSVYLGYTDTVPGALIGGLWGFTDGFVCGYAVAWMYNKCLV